MEAGVDQRELLFLLGQPHQLLDLSQGKEGLQVRFLIRRERATPAVAGEKRLTQRGIRGMAIELR